MQKNHDRYPHHHVLKVDRQCPRKEKFLIERDGFCIGLLAKPTLCLGNGHCFMLGLGIIANKRVAVAEARLP
jgi:hypothetical protein